MNTTCAHRVSLLATLILVFAPLVSSASIPEPDTVLYGTLTLGGDTLMAGTVEAVHGTDVIASSPIADIGGESAFLLRLPMVYLVSGETMAPPGSVVVSDAVDFRVNGVPLAASHTVTDRGIILRIDPSAPGTLFSLSGTAAGGSVSILINGVNIAIATATGETAAEVAANLAAAINANSTLQGLGVSGSSQGNQVITNGVVTDSNIADSGLNPPLVPSLPFGWIVALILMLLSLPLVLPQSPQTAV